MVNKAILVGNVGGDPEVRTTASGAKVANFSLATSRKWKNKNGEQQESTQWHKIVLWSALADLAEKYVKKGSQLYLEGEIEYRTYEDKEGQTRYITEINGREMRFLGGKSDNGNGGRGSQGSSRAAEPAKKPATVPAESYEDFGGDDDELPF